MKTEVSSSVQHAKVAHLCHLYRERGELGCVSKGNRGGSYKIIGNIEGLEADEVGDLGRKFRESISAEGEVLEAR